VRVGDTTRTVSMTGGQGTISAPKERPVAIDPQEWLLRAAPAGPGGPNDKRRR
jgi:hypothetical protein